MLHYAPVRGEVRCRGVEVTYSKVRHEVPKEIAFTIECSVRTAWEAIYRLLDRGPAPPPVYQS